LTVTIEQKNAISKNDELTATFDCAKFTLRHCNSKLTLTFTKDAKKYEHEVELECEAAKPPIIDAKYAD
jgi:hypothetical protein